MSMPAYRALTWDHPRGYNALAAAARTMAPMHGLSIVWDKQPLEGFESAPIEELFARYDLVVLDHPHIGAAVAAGCLQPLDGLFDSAALGAIARRTIGRSFASYGYVGRQWALPLDAATQVLAWRPDLMSAPPRTWDAVEEAADWLGLALSIAGPHAILAILSVAVALSPSPASWGEDCFVDERSGIRAVELLTRLMARARPTLLPANPIGILEHMARHDDVAFCPLIFGYVTYGRPAAGRHAIAFAEAPRAALNSHPGSTLGGTGIGISTRAKVTPQLLAHLDWLMGESTQAGFISAHDGQPSARSAWTSDSINAHWNGFYRNTSATMDAAIVRPRFAGYIAFQEWASAFLRSAIAGGIPAPDIVAEINTRYHAARGNLQP
ncbi:extracellular solute-binding protein [uncultured Devosia sp.]|uniref:extracellular solute-binding protein n=1 Tax=uncultured Devosia sp. TaxID=211434 RepID=UPI0035C9A092